MRSTSAESVERPPSRLRRALVLSSAGTGMTRLAGAMGGLLAARLLGPSGRGQLAVLVLFATVLAMGAAAGLQFWVARRVAQTRGIGAVRSTVRVHVLVMVLGVTLVSLLFGGLVAGLAEVGPLTVAAAGAFALSMAINLVVLALPNGLRLMGVVASATVTAAVVYAAVVAGLLAADIASPALVLAGGVAGNVLSIALVLGWTTRAPRGSDPAAPGLAEYGRAVRFGLPAGLGELVFLAMLRVDVVIVACFLPLRQVGLYAVATALTELLWVVPDGVAQVVLPTTARAPEHSRTNQLLWVAVVSTATSGAVLLVVVDRLLDVGFGPKFGGATAAVPWLVAAAIAGGVWKIVGAEVVAQGRSGPRLTSALVGLVAMVGVDLVAVPALGIAGAAFGSAVGYTFAAAVVARAWWVMRRVAEGTTPVVDESSACTLGADVSGWRGPEPAVEVQA